MAAVPSFGAEARTHLRVDSPESGFSRAELSRFIGDRVIRDSARIFSGTVIAVEHERGAANGNIATTRIAFRVEEPIRGVRRGQTVNIREWSGLWQGGERYRVGERGLLFLYPSSRLGLTSPVGGRMGRFRVDRAGRVEIEPDQRKGLQPSSEEWLRGTAPARVAARWIDVRSLAAAIRGGVTE